MPVRRLCRRLGIPPSTWYYWRSCELAGRPAKRWPTPVLDAIEEPAAELAGRFSAWGHRKIWELLRGDGVSVSASSVARAMKRRGLLLPVRYLKEQRAQLHRALNALMAIQRFDFKRNVEGPARILANQARVVTTAIKSAETDFLKTNPGVINDLFKAAGIDAAAPPPKK